jgi:hypothetical protein
MMRDAANRAGKLDIVLDNFEPEPLPVDIIYAPRKPVLLNLIRAVTLLAGAIEAVKRQRKLIL